MLSALYYIFTLLQVTFWFIISIIVLAFTYPFDKSRRWVHECQSPILPVGTVCRPLNCRALPVL